MNSCVGSVAHRGMLQGCPPAERQGSALDLRECVGDPVRDSGLNQGQLSRMADRSPDSAVVNPLMMEATARIGPGRMNDMGREASAVAG